MGKRIDALLGRTFRFAKLKALLKQAVYRIDILKNQKKTRCFHARSDVTGLLKQGKEESALIRVEHVIKEQNMWDAFVLMEGYCNLLIQRGVLLQKHESCPEDLKEAISGLAFAASRCGELPELQEARSVFTTRFGKEFTAAAVELRNNSGVNANMIRKLSTRQPSLEIRLKVLREIATENGITLNLKEVSSRINEELQINQNQSQPELNQNTENSTEVGSADDSDNSVELVQEKRFSGRLKAKEEFIDVETAAQVAFEAAAYAAEAARAAVKLSRTESQDKGSDDGSSNLSHRRRNTVNGNRGEGSSRSKLHETPGVETSSSESDNEEQVTKQEEEDEAELGRSVFVSNSDSIKIESKELDCIKGNGESPSDFDHSELGINKNHSARKTDKLSNQRGRTGFPFEKTREFEEFSDDELSENAEALKLHNTADQKESRERYPTYKSHEDVSDVVDSPRKLQDSMAEKMKISSGLNQKLTTQRGTRFVSVRTRRGAMQQQRSIGSH